MGLERVIEKEKRVELREVQYAYTRTQDIYLPTLLSNVRKKLLKHVKRILTKNNKILVTE